MCGPTQFAAMPVWSAFVQVPSTKGQGWVKGGRTAPLRTVFHAAVLTTLVHVAHGGDVRGRRDLQSGDPPNGKGGVMGIPEPVWVVSPHLLVGQTVAAALQSVGTPAKAHPWEWAVEGRELMGVAPRPPRHLVVILDGLDGPKVVEQVNRIAEAGGVRVLVVTSGEFAVWWGGLLESDAIDVVTMTTSVVQLAEAVERFLAGDSSMDSEGRQELRTSWSEAVERRRRIVSLLATLSPQQRRVLELLASGHRVSEVGTLMGVTRGTVRSHVKSLRAKLGARNQLEAVAMLHQAHVDVTGSDLVPRPREVIGNGHAVTRR